MASRSPRPLIVRMRSPAASPALAPAVRGRTAATTTPSAIERGFIRRSGLVGVDGVEEAHALHDVLQPGEDREGRGQPDHALEPGRPAIEGRHHAEEDGDDLKERGELARARGARRDTAARHVDGEGADDENEVAADDDRGDPEW